MSVMMLSPSFALYLEESLNISPSYSGYILGAMSVSYVIFCPIVGLLCGKLNRRLIVFIALTLCGVSSIIIGKPSYLGV
jgi:predicted MFS family arabinose efflux permease